MKNIYNKVIGLAFSGMVLLVFTSADSINSAHELFGSGGRIGSTGSPGEKTCSASGCHGAGKNGGLPDNGGTGSIVISASPAFTNNTYSPGTTYTITVTVAESGRSLFGFNFEALDNSGNTSPTVNNSVGTITITNSAKTQKAQVGGTGRVNVTNQKNAGAVTNSASFAFNWTAPASGTVNMYAAGNAADKSSTATAGDNIYKTSLQLTPAGVGIAEANSKVVSDLNIYPNLSNNELNLFFQLDKTQSTTILLHSISGQLINTIDAGVLSSGEQNIKLSVANLTNAIYIVSVITPEGKLSKKIALSGF